MTVKLLSEPVDRINVIRDENCWFKANYEFQRLNNFIIRSTALTKLTETYLISIVQAKLGNRKYNPL